MTTTHEHSVFYSEITNEIAGLEAKLNRLRGVAEYHREQAGLNGTATYSTEAIKIPPKKYVRMKQLAAAHDVLKIAGKPLKTAEIVDLMIEGGFPCTDKGRLRNAIFTSMRRKDKVFEKADEVGPGYWTLKK